MAEPNGLLIVLPVPFRMKDGELLFEAQACNGLERWADNFGYVRVAASVLPESMAEQDRTITWLNTKHLAEPHRFELVPLPWVASISDFIAHYPETRKRLARLVSQSRYMGFGIGGLFSDWAAIGAIEAYRQKKPYAVQTDLVEHEAVLQVSREEKWPVRLKARLMSFLMDKYYAWIIRRAALGLWHGADCYAAYSRYCRHNFLIHDVHTKPSDIISEAELDAKSQHLMTDETLRICYTGRMATEKAPLDWVKAIEKAHRLGVKLQAIWVGDGVLRESMEKMIAERGLEDVIQLTGYERDRAKVMQYIRQSHLMLFTHITPESPRCLLEALLNGTPIIGYESDYARDLVHDKGGGAFVPVRAWEKLGELVSELAGDRPRLAQLTREAGENGQRFSDEVVFRERSQLIKEYL